MEERAKVQFVPSGGTLRQFDLRVPEEGVFSTFFVPKGTRFLGVDASESGWLTLRGVSPPKVEEMYEWKATGVVDGQDSPPFAFYLGTFDEISVFIHSPTS